ncbi:MAG: hypothetical protein R3C15_11075 [Thermoleophilia bacterium]
MSLLGRLLRPLARPGAERARALLGGREPVLADELASCFGVESAGVTQLRGNGCLALGPDLLVFAMWLPRRDVVIPRTRIVEVDTTRGHLGKTVGRPLLRVAWTREDGERDRVAWLVRDLDAWLAALGYETSAQ